MRIVHVVLSLDVGGQERLILNLSRALQKRGHDVRVVSMSPGGSLRPEFGSIETIDVVKGKGLDLMLVPKLARTLRRLAPDVVHTHNAASLVYGAPAARLALIGRVVHTKHGANSWTQGALALARVGAKLVSAFVAVSRETADVARRDERPPEKRIRVVPNGIPLEQFRADSEARARIRAELGIPQRAVVVGTVARLVPEKDHPLLVRAMKPMLRDDLRLVIVGDGPSRRETESAIEGETSRYVTLTGARRDVPALLASFDVFAMSSRTEGLPLVVPEAMASGLPVVSTAVGGLPGVISPEVGLLVPHGDAEALGRALEALAGEPARRRALGERAASWAREQFSLDRMTSEYEALYGA
jgi:glycosyltransferase involved in cell wall biosynthesis